MFTNIPLTHLTPDSTISVVDSCYPQNNTDVYSLTPSSSIIYTVTGLDTYNLSGSGNFKLRIQARWFPDIFDPETGTFGVDSPITLDSFDFKKLKVRVRFTGNSSWTPAQIRSNERYSQFERLVPLHWSSLDILIPGCIGHDYASIELINDDPDNPIQICAVNLYAVM